MINRTAPVLLAALILGTTVGTGASYYHYGRETRVFGFSKPSLSTAGDGSQHGPAPASLATQKRSRIDVVGDSTYDFGVMSRNERRSYTFTVRNAGEAVLTVFFIDKSCQCTDVTMSRNEIPPGEASEITLTWQPTTFNPEFHQTARFRTNDPGRIELDLTVKGKVQQVVQTSPRSVDLGLVRSGAAATSEVRVFGYQDPNLRISQVELLDADTAEFFTTRVETLSSTDLAQEAGALTGERVRVDLRGGLPVGPVHQRLRVHLNLPDLAPLEIPVEGQITGSFALAGKGYREASQIWELGPLSGDQVHRQDLWILPRTDVSTDLRLTITRVDPSEVLAAEIIPVATASSRPRYKLTLRIQPIERVVSRLGNQQGDLAEIVIETSLPDTPIIRIPVAFAIASQTEEE